MKKWWLPFLAIAGLSLVFLLHWISPIRAQSVESVAPWTQARRSPSLQSIVAKPGLWYYPPGVPTQGCMANPEPEPKIRFTRGTLNLSRFRGPLQSARWASSAPDWLQSYQPPEEIALAHPTNFGERFQRDITGQSAARQPIVVLHETVIPGWLTVKSFQKANRSASYHALIKRNGTIFYMVPPDKRAFGAGDSIFSGPNGRETTRTSRIYPASVNNFAYHVSLETPPDGKHNGNTHSGYTDAQYTSLAWLVSKTGVPSNRIDTHQGVDRSGSRRDPRSFDQRKFRSLLGQFPKTSEINVGCWRY